MTTQSCHALLLPSEDETSECLRPLDAQVDADRALQVSSDFVGIESEGRVPLELYDLIKQRASKMKADTLALAEFEDGRTAMFGHWPFDDYDEEEYA
ncbi:hypothetical protein T440DRAFT_538650 [Plenodomus tracheiphilus IPT5]|uniref:Uncharacterized protein n=1 Tax=Plenodomus tracheiphilus IPT5 TaxID=1408161 RepID=A0A6A7AZ37_9PLEO|nr:hypothetical protein T440DRAFT_538650 [Plenodomus tracheiphilus IPT5]